MRYTELLIESRQISLAKKAYASLSHEAKDAIDRWERSEWIGGPLEKHMAANDDVWQEIDRAFQPVRDSIPDGQIKLYRGIRTQSENKLPRTLESWTSERAVAEYFAGLRTQQTKAGRSTLYAVPSVQQIDQAVAQYNAKGYTQMFNQYFIRSRENPELFNIYDRHKEFVTDGDDLRDHLMTEYEWRQERNEKNAAKGQVKEQVFPVNRLVWLTNNLNSKEYIVRVG